MELELEGFTAGSTDTLSRHVHPAWRVTHDGSLRNGGIELITNGGLGGEQLFNAFERLATGLERVNYDASFRCSTHMHINMLDFTVNQVVRFLLVYTACEPVLFAFCGAYRKSSNFCTPVSDSLPFHRKLIGRMYDNAIATRSAVQSVNKYTALNLAPLFPSDRSPALGTVEFRGGRPLTTLEEMLTQANLLLSIKEYVRTFTGTEEEMLTGLAVGLNSTVYQNGVAAGLTASDSNLENALVHAWCLLKSYQEGQAYAKKVGMAKKGAYFDPEMADRLAGLTDRPRARSNNAYTTWNGNPTVEGPEAPARRASAASPTDGLLDYDITTMTELEALVRRSDWTRFYGNLAPLYANDMTVKTDAAWAMLSGNDLINREDVSTLVFNWIGAWAPREHVNKLLGSIAKLGGLAARQMDTSHRHLRSPLGVRFDVNNRPGTAANLRYKLSPSAWNRIASRVLGLDGSVMTNHNLWSQMLGSGVRIKNRMELMRLCTERGLDDAYEQLSAINTISAVRLYALLRLLNRPSERYVHVDHLATYDRWAPVFDLIRAAGGKVPVLLQGEGVGRRCHFLAVNSSMGFTTDGVITTAQTHDPRQVGEYEVY